MGPQSADLLKATIETASHRWSGTLATLIGLVTLFVTASGVFGEMQQSLNKIWKVKPDGVSLSRLVRARAASLGLVAALGFLLLVSLAASTAIAALGELINRSLPFGEIHRQRHQHGRLLRADSAALRRDLQSPARPQAQMA
ncbi:YhjD/YihY/BrkB family envelope integrity protein [Mesorhizobium sp. Cs1299R1N3]|uniref:YhjD/YihY/BrkB family envelope integrity protein n=1 Tax=Mesorhizobium sp. Cs1299R1N3 TaxID=3015173 RepID=UPI00301B7A04